jgi:hypothetical protein
MEARLPQLESALRGEYRPGSTEEFMALALHCRERGRFVDVFRLCERLQRAPGSFLAAIMVRAANGEGAEPVAPEPRAELRKLALDTIRGELDRRRKLLAEGRPDLTRLFRAELGRWLTSDDFASVRHPRALERPTETERRGWEDFWLDVRRTLDGEPARDDSPSSEGDGSGRGRVGVPPGA